jgi:arylsulfatase A-like enzyme
LRLYKLLAAVAALFLFAVVMPSVPGEQELPSVVEATERPNIVFILTDDLEADSKAEKHMDQLRRLVTDRGTTFENTFTPDSICCPSRASFLLGRYTHNHEIEGNSLPNGGFEKFRNLGHERRTVAVWLQEAGYSTFYAGKYFNHYKDTRHVPPGWSRWYGATRNHYYDFELNENGRIVSYKGESYHTDVLSKKATQYIKQMSDGEKPFFMYLAPKAPHMPAEAAPRHRGMFEKVRAPRLPNFNEKDVDDKPRWVRGKDRLNSEEIGEIDQLHRKRMRSMQAVDDMVGNVVSTLRETGQLDNTYVIFTSDNGYHLGHHRLPPGKWTPYEENIKVPFIVRGPGVPAGQSRSHMVLNNDFAPTIAELAGTTAPASVDGRSLTPLLGGDPPPVSEWRSAFLVESKGNYSLSRPRFEAVRTAGSLYVEYDTGEKELYDLREDPYQLTNRYRTAEPEVRQALESRLSALRDCSGAGCRAAEDGSEAPSGETTPVP